jgi:2-polyprenyl-3-methyl-5-hydroxy-6-metoxy-1,4-benzoquinol methylase
MTEVLIDAAAELTVIEPSAIYCDTVKKRLTEKNNPPSRVINSFLSDVSGEPVYDVAVLASLLHHIENPVYFLEDLKRFLHKKSQVIATVPNMSSLHRRIGVKADLLADVYDSTERNDTFNQYGRFDIERLKALFHSSGYEIIESYGYMLKPFNSNQMMSLNLEVSVIDALFELGKEFQVLASQLYVRAVMK